MSHSKTPRAQRSDKRPARNPKPTATPSTGRDQAYEVGYGKPPADTRFKAGRSGNPKGRPKGRKNLKTIIQEVFDAKITVREGGRTRSITKAEGLVLRHFEKALKGDHHAMTALIRMAAEVGLLESSEVQLEAAPLSNEEKKILSEILAVQPKQTEKRS